MQTDERVHSKVLQGVNELAYFSNIWTNFGDNNADIRKIWRLSAVKCFLLNK